MRFGKNLESQKVSEWKEHYLDYAKLKSLLKEDDPRDDETSWTERDESNFCDEFFNVQFQKVVAFHATTIEALEKRAEEVGTALQKLAPSDGQNAGDITRSRFRNFEEDLDDISNEANRLKSFDQLNFTACRKIVKKHDRKRGHLYRIRPMLQLNVDKSGFNDDKSYAPLLEKMSAMYFIVRQNLDDAPEGLSSSFSDVAPQSQNDERYTAYKCKCFSQDTGRCRSAIDFSQVSRQQLTVCSYCFHE
jgi:SPX domain protein involved in polyphosphate accumulation